MHLMRSCFSFGLWPAALAVGRARGGATKRAKWIKTEVFFGADVPGRAKVTPAEWAAFLDAELTPKFPAGLTVFEAYGQMQHAKGAIEKQTTRVVLLVHPDAPAAHQQIHDIIKTYQTRFNHAQVMHLHTSVAAEFFAD